MSRRVKKRPLGDVSEGLSDFIMTGKRKRDRVGLPEGICTVLVCVLTYLFTHNVSFN